MIAAPIPAQPDGLGQWNDLVRVGWVERFEFYLLNLDIKWPYVEKLEQVDRKNDYVFVLEDFYLAFVWIIIFQ